VSGLLWKLLQLGQATMAILSQNKNISSNKKKIASKNKEIVAHSHLFSRVSKYELKETLPHKMHPPTPNTVGNIGIIFW